MESRAVWPGMVRIMKVSRAKPREGLFPRSGATSLAVVVIRIHHKTIVCILLATSMKRRKRVMSL